MLQYLDKKMDYSETVQFPTCKKDKANCATG